MQWLVFKNLTLSYDQENWCRLRAIKICPHILAKYTYRWTTIFCCLLWLSLLGFVCCCYVTVNTTLKMTGHCIRMAQNIARSFSVHVTDNVNAFSLEFCGSNLLPFYITLKDIRSNQAWHRISSMFTVSEPTNCICLLIKWCFVTISRKDVKDKKTDFTATQMPKNSNATKTSNLCIQFHAHKIL